MYKYIKKVKPNQY